MDQFCTVGNTSVNVHCPRCQSVQVYRHGQNPKGYDRFRCRDCHRVFQLTKG
ncbi:IS1 family transposase, partial [Erwinia sp. OLCASP19]|uniref:IS1 family transposase n=1 Tax=Erwinia sp. OLCASP19 TaxID=1912594 RepID=UPI00315D4D5F